MSVLKQYYHWFTKKLWNVKTEIKLFTLDLIRSEGSLPYRLDSILAFLYDIEDLVI